MKNKIIKLKILIIAILLIIMPSVVFAYSGIDTDITIGNTPAINSSVDMTQKIVGPIQVIGSVVSVLALVIIGLRYMFSSVEEKASMKGVIGYYVTGAVLVFATSNVLGIAHNMFDHLEHTYNGTIIQNATCTTEGKMRYECSVCGKVKEEKIPTTGGHIYGNWTTKTAATCTEAEVEKRTCTRTGCGHEETRTGDIAAQGHSYGSWTTKTAATCTADRVKKRTCTRCNKEETETVAGTALGRTQLWQLDNKNSSDMSSS